MGLLEIKDNNKLSEETAYIMGEKCMLAMYLTENSFLKYTEN